MELRFGVTFGVALIAFILFILFCVRNEVKFVDLASHDPGEEIMSTEKQTDSQSEEQDGVLEEEEQKNRSDQEENDDDQGDRQEDETGEMEVEETEREGVEVEVKNEDMKEEEIRRVNKEAILGAFLQVSEPALVSSHHDGFLRFWNFSVSFEIQTLVLNIVVSVRLNTFVR